jgi:hypothetical protein
LEKQIRTALLNEIEERTLTHHYLQTAYSHAFTAFMLPVAPRTSEQNVREFTRIQAKGCRLQAQEKVRARAAQMIRRLDALSL